MHFDDLNIFFGLLIAIIIGIGILLYGIKEINIAIVILLLTPFFTSLFFKNEVLWINEDVETGIAGYLRGSIIIYCGLIGLFTFIKRWPLNKGRVPYIYLLLAAFILLAFISTTYSADEKYTLIRALFFGGIFIFLIGLESWMDSIDKLYTTLNVMFYAISVVIVLCLISLAFPSRSWWWKSPNRFIGLFQHPNLMGAYVMMFYPIGLWKYYNAQENSYVKKLSLVILIIAFALQVLTGSRTTLITSVIGVSTWLFIKRKTTKLVAILGLISLFALSLLFVYTPENLVRGDASTSLTITGRDVIWEGAIKRYMQRPLLGYGHMVESKILNFQSMEGEFSVATAQQPLHNGYLSIAIGTGTIGLLLWLGIILFPLIKITRIRQGNIIDFKAYYVSTTIMVIIANFFESFLTGYIGGAGDAFFWFAWLIGIKVTDFVFEE